MRRVGEDGGELVWATKGRWVSDATFEVTSRSVLEGIVRTLTLTFQDHRVQAEMQINAGPRGRFEGAATEP